MINTATIQQPSENQRNRFLLLRFFPYPCLLVTGAKRDGFGFSETCLKERQCFLSENQ